MIVLLREPATPRQIARMLEDWKVLIKVVVDVRQEVAAGGGEVHVDGAAQLLAEGSRHEDLWGATWYPENREAHLEALFNIRPRHGNVWVRIEDRGTRAAVEALVRNLLGASPGASSALRAPSPAPQDRKAARERFLRDPLSARLTAIAALLARAASVVPHPVHAETAAGLLDEARHFIEWTAAELEPDAAGELVDLQLAVTLWLRLSETSHVGALPRALLAHEAARSAERVRVLSAQAAESGPRDGSVRKRG